MSDVVVRPARPDELPAILAIHRAAFPEEAEVIADLVSGLVANPGHRPGVSLVAERNGRIAGHVLFSAALVPTLDGADLEVALLAPLGVDPRAQGEGIGGALVAEGLSAVKAAGFEIAVVLGHPGYYPRFGFAQAPAALEAPYPIAIPEAWMALDLVPGSVARASGTITVAEPLRPAEMWSE